jgi:hypothetical protein
VLDFQKFLNGILCFRPTVTNITQANQLVVGIIKSGTAQALYQSTAGTMNIANNKGSHYSN